MTEEERDEMMRSNWKAQMAAFGYGPDGLALPQKETSGWISVKDRLPEEETEYLCWFGDYPMGAFVMVCRWNKIRGAFWCYSDNAKWAFVTHWMPLPEPPKE